MADLSQGVLNLQSRGGGYLRSVLLSFQPGPDDPWVPQEMIREYGLVEGANVGGLVRPGAKGPQVVEIETVCGISPEQFAARRRFEQLTAIDPTERFRLGDCGNLAMRVVELIAPIGKGTRWLIVAPPKTGKTILLEQLAQAIQASEPETRIIVLLIDERPEEVTHFRRSVGAEVLASSNDQTLESHTNLAELTMAHIRTELECGRNIVLLMDSITRLSRAFNLHGSGAGRTMTGGLDAKALDVPRRFFGLARNIEKGGSVTVIATALVQTGSRMDDFIFEEFKSTGNSELVLDRGLAEARVFPAVNLLASGTRREELLYAPEQMEKLAIVRRWIAARDPKSAMTGLLDLLQKAPSNDEFLRRIKSKK